MGATPNPSNPESPASRKVRRRLAAAERQAAAGERSHAEQIARLDERPGRAARERKRLAE